MVMQGISYATAKKKKGMTVGFVTFENIEQLKNAIEVIIGMFILLTCMSNWEVTMTLASQHE